MRLSKQYSRLRMREHNVFHKRLVEIARCRDDALAQLQQLSPALFQAAMVPDDTLFPIRAKQPTETPAPEDAGTAFDPAAIARDQAGAK